MKLRTLLALTGTLVTLLVASPAAAQTRVSMAGQGSVAGLAGFGVGFEGGSFFAFGARGGYTLPMNLYLGGTALGHVSLDSSGAFVLAINAECGYDITVGPVIIRPYGGLGFAMWFANSPSFTNPITGETIGGTSSSSAHFLLKFGGTLLFPLGPTWFVGADTNISVILGDGSTSVWTFLGTFGARFGG